MGLAVFCVQVFENSACVCCVARQQVQYVQPGHLRRLDGILLLQQCSTRLCLWHEMTLGVHFDCQWQFQCTDRVARRASFEDCLLQSFVCKILSTLHVFVALRDSRCSTRAHVQPGHFRRLDGILLQQQCSTKLSPWHKMTVGAFTGLCLVTRTHQVLTRGKSRF